MRFSAKPRVNLKKKVLLLNDTGMDGLILVQKPKGLTSHDVVEAVREIYQMKRVGHFGTLDPMATGLILIGLGQATRLFPFLSKADKEYSGRLRFGFSTDTYDAEGQPASSESEQYPEKSGLKKILSRYEGVIEQRVPPYSAKKHQGRPLYALAREKKETPVKTVQVMVHSFQMVRYTPPFLDFTVKCSSGTYIRSLVHEIGQIVKCGAHLRELTRTTVGDFSLSDSYSLEQLRKMSHHGKSFPDLVPLEKINPEFPKVILKEKGVRLARNGNDITADDIDKVFSLNSENTQSETFRLFDHKNALLAYARKYPNGESYHPFLVLGRGEEAQ